MRGTRPGVAVLYNTPTLPAGHPHGASEADVVAVARGVVAALESAGFEAWEQPAGPPLVDLVAELHGTAPDLVFNLIEGFAGSSVGEAYITGLLELLGLPYTGCPPEAQLLCHRKGTAKALLSGMGCPTAPFLVVSGEVDPDPAFEGPYFVKPEAEDASLGIDQGSVIPDRRGLADRVAMLRSSLGGAVLIEAYLPGPEYNVGILDLGGPAPLPVAEVVYEARSETWPILTYDAKWDVGSPEDLGSPIRCPARIAPALARDLGDLALTAFRTTRCRGYARVDFRLDPEGRPMILEVNPNPALGPDGGWARALRASGRDYGTTVADMARQALARGGRRG